jgi:hypothetical protein
MAGQSEAILYEGLGGVYKRIHRFQQVPQCLRQRGSLGHSRQFSLAAVGYPD